jgi:CRISPR-associated protein Csx10
MKVKLIIQADTPVAFRSNRNQDAPDTLDYLPGSTLRGGLAAAHAMLRPEARDEFESFFLSDSVRFGNGYPSDFEQPELQDDNLPVEPLPQTALSCKRCPGFLSQPSGDTRWNPHGVRDSLIPMALLAMASEGEAELQGAENDCGYSEHDGPACTEPLERFNGFIRRLTGNAIYARTRPPKELRTKTGISRSRGAVHEGILYSRRMLSHKVRFQSQLQLVPELTQSLHAFIQEASEAGLLRFGNNRTRGLGGVSLLGWLPDGSPSAADGIAGRLQIFNDSFSQIASSSQIELKHSSYLPVYALTDVILRDELFRYRGRLDGQWLAAELGLEGASLVFMSSVLRRVTGWNALSGLPRSDEWAIALGSVFLLGLPRALNESDVQRLQTLEEQGTGRRQAEGFGRVRIGDPFHLEVTRV